jgi:hypothetical protein
MYVIKIVDFDDRPEFKVSISLLDAIRYFEEAGRSALFEVVKSANLYEVADLGDAPHAIAMVESGRAIDRTCDLPKDDSQFSE